jgi:SAM-dependent MidA family methyltransferase
MPDSRPPHAVSDSPDGLPLPTKELQQHSEKIRQLICDVIEEQGGKITFADYMNLALYTPRLGYYSAGLQKFGRQGDFITAPEISPIFSQCLAHQCVSLMQSMDRQIILEMGAGSGTMAVDLVVELERQHCLPEKYLILELSAELRDRQQQHIREKIPHLYQHFKWLDQLPDKPFSGIIIANELLDAMPVHLVKMDGEKINERYVGVKEGKFFWLDDTPSSQRLLDRAKAIRKSQQPLADLNVQPDQTYITEINLYASDWLRSISEILETGAILLVDYGYTAQEYYHPQRCMGTLMCHFQHHRHDNPLILPGIQDITAHVDFTALAMTGLESGLQLDGFTTQAHFLMNGGLMEIVNRFDPENMLKYAAIAQQIKHLTLPEEMGELFKVVLLSRNMSISLPAFQFKDLRHRL